MDTSNAIKKIGELIRENLPDTTANTWFEVSGSYAYLVYTDRILLCTAEEGKAESVDKLLECRLFNQEKELRIKRTALHKPCIFRMITDNLETQTAESKAKTVDVESLIAGQVNDSQADWKTPVQYDYYFDKNYFLDIDATTLESRNSSDSADSDHIERQTKWNYIPGTGKKGYSLPVEIKTTQITVDEGKTSTIATNQIRIRNYVAYYEETGQAYIRDWRIVGFVYEGEMTCGAEEKGV